ncbi:MAG: sporulation protein [Oscillospiraceae bacterium]|nr:sporulation protein [Oscillospiraceae bacterium]
MSYDGSSQPRAEAMHGISMEERKRLSISRVEDVERFDEREIIVHTTEGTLVIGGEDLSISRLSVDSGDVAVQGLISDLHYEDAAPERGLWSKLFH